AEETVQVLVRELFPRSVLVTPNLDEVGLLLGHPVTEAAALQAAAAELLALGAPAALVKGGHLRGDEVVDVLAQAGPPAEFQVLRGSRIASNNTHGTGCTLSSAIACGLALGQTLPQAVAQAQAYVRAAMTAGAGVRTGHGHGPLDHGHAPVASRRLPLA